MWQRLQAEVRGMLEGNGVPAAELDVFMWHVFGVHGRQPHVWRTARDLVRDTVRLADRFFADAPTARAKVLCDVVITYVLNTVGM